MPINSLEDIWALAAEELKNIITETAFKCFLEELVPVSFSEGEFSLSCKDEFTRTIIVDNYTDILQQAFKSALGLDIKIKILCEEEEDEKIKNAERFSEGLSFEDFFTFENFIVGSTNRFAHAASLAVADNPNIIYNPLIIYGPSGVGKTHLMLAIKNHMKKLFPSRKIEYIRSEEFTNELIRALQDGKLGLGTIDDFRHKYRNVDVLLIDDIHFIAGKEQTQEEFFNTFNTLLQNNKQIVVTLDRPPREVKTLDDRIRSRLESGLFADITTPDFETRVGIIKTKADQLGVAIEDSVVYYIAEHIKVNTRQLEGVVKKIQAYSAIVHRVPTMGAIQNIIKDVMEDSQPKPIEISTIIEEVGRTYNVSPEEILSNRKTAPLVLARQVAMYISRETTSLSFKEIGESFGKDHTTVLYNVRKVEEFLKDKPYQRELVEDLINNLKSNH